MALVTNFFLGANSGEGFQNLFFPDPRIWRIYDLMVLKGGCGKNTFMREIGRAMEGGRDAGGVPVVLWTRTLWTALCCRICGAPWWTAPAPMAQHH